MSRLGIGEGKVTTGGILGAFRLDGDTAVVTGGGRGIGRAVAIGLAEAGARVCIGDVDLAAAEMVADSIRSQGGASAVIELDVADEASVEAGFGKIAESHGGIQILVNNAGMAIRRPSMELSRADWDKVVAVNMTGVFLCARVAARHMAAGRGGRIVNMASIMGLSGGGLYPNISYQATKGAVVNMTRALALEWAEAGIRVNAVAPTWVRTDFIKGLLDQPELVARIEAMTPLRRLAEPSDIVGAVLFLASEASAMVTGHTLPVDGGILAQ
jgi:NAD(P)-dependent dehydrogenase (short-subunit alcohol dehydrogenase family)